MLGKTTIPCNPCMQRRSSPVPIGGASLRRGNRGHDLVHSPMIHPCWGKPGTYRGFLGRDLLKTTTRRLNGCRGRAVRNPNRLLRVEIGTKIFCLSKSPSLLRRRRACRSPPISNQSAMAVVLEGTGFGRRRGPQVAL